MSPRSEEQVQEIREQRMNQILFISLELFATNGYHSTSISMIARKAGISKGLLYNYFDSKEALLLAIVEQGTQAGEKMTKEAFADTDPKQALRSLIEKVFAVIEEDQKYWKFYMSLMMQPGIMEGIKKNLHGQIQKSIRMGEDFFRRLGYKDPLTESLLFSATLDGLLMHSMANFDEYPVEKLKMKLINTYCK